MKTFILLALLVLTQVLGDIWLSRAMKLYGEVNLLDPSLWLPLGAYLLGSPWVWLAIGFLVTSLGLYLTAISRLDLSYVLPIHASTYLFNALFAWWILGEQISGSRWLSTLLISVGVLLVGFGQGRTPNSPQPRLPANLSAKNVPLFWLPLGISVSKTWLAVIVLALADASGDVLLALGMRRVGRVGKLALKQVFPLFRRIISNPAILSGISCQAIAFLMFISALSWADISFVRPATALTYILSLSGARFILHEQVDRNRLMGIIMIGFGILLHR